MVELNALIINGESTADLPFFCGVTDNSPPARAIKKNKIYELEHVNGAVVQSINAYGLVEKTYNFYLHDVTVANVRRFKSFIGYSGWFTPSDDLGIRYKFINAVPTVEPLDMTDGYRVSVVFTCEPFAYENESVGVLGASIVNHTNAPMYPLIKLTGTTGANTFLQIGNQRMTFTSGINGVVFVECKHGFQDVYTSTSSINNQIRGPFFEIEPGTHSVTKGTGITAVEITKRWGWL